MLNTTTDKKHLDRLEAGRSDFFDLARKDESTLLLVRKSLSDAGLDSERVLSLLADIHAREIQKNPAIRSAVLNQVKDYIRAAGSLKLPPLPADYQPEVETPLPLSDSIQMQYHGTLNLDDPFANGLPTGKTLPTRLMTQRDLTDSRLPSISAAAALEKRDSIAEAKSRNKAEGLRLKRQGK